MARNWTSEKDAQGIVWLSLDVPGKNVNTLGEEALEDFDTLLAEIEQHPPQALVIRSTKEKGFCAGADIDEIARRNEDELRSLITRGDDILGRLSRLGCPTVAMIHGSCLGAGLELALACDSRVCTRDASLGLPEVKLGLHPGLGGIYRLPLTVAPPAALKMMLTGNTVDGDKARRMGLVTHSVEKRHLETAARSAAQRRRKKNIAARAKSRALHIAPVRRFIAGQARKQTAKRANADHYPGPFALLDLWERYGGDEKILPHEAESFARLAVGPTARNLIRLFHLRNELTAAGRQGAGDDIRHIHVIGAGTMGGDIAAWCALKGYTVSLSDMKREMIGDAVKRAAGLFARKKPDADERMPMDRLIPDESGHGAAHADLIIEAVPENAELKRKIYEQLHGNLKRNAIIATNTSSLRLEELADATGRPTRFVGLHFFNPVAKLPLVEVVAGQDTAQTTLHRVLGFAADIGKIPVPVRSAPGFLVNRVLTPYLIEAMHLMADGYEPAMIDKAAEAFGMPQGPIEVADAVGLDICLSVAEVLHKELPEEVPGIPDRLRKMVDEGVLGRKSGRGFYRYKKGKAQKPAVDGSPDSELQDRLILPMLNIAVRCLREEVVEKEDHVDAGLVFGTGFAPFRGGPLRYARKIGPARIKDKLKQFERDLDAPRFQPDAGWNDLNR